MGVTGILKLMSVLAFCQKTTCNCYFTQVDKLLKNSPDRFYGKNTLCSCARSCCIEDSCLSFMFNKHNSSCHFLMELSPITHQAQFEYVIFNRALVRMEKSVRIMVATNEDARWKRFLQVRVNATSDFVLKQYMFGTSPAILNTFDVLPKLRRIVYSTLEKPELQLDKIDDSSSTSLMLSKDIMPVIALTTDKINNTIYFMNGHNMYHITLKGSPKILAKVSSAGAEPSLTVDPFTSKLFMTNSIELFTISIITKKQESVLVDIRRFKDIAFDIDQRSLYILSDNIYSLTDLNGQPTKRLIKTLPAGVAAFQLLAYGNNLCAHLLGEIRYFNLVSGQEKTINVSITNTYWKMIMFPDA